MPEQVPPPSIRRSRDDCARRAGSGDPREHRGRSGAPVGRWRGDDEPPVDRLVCRGPDPGAAAGLRGHRPGRPRVERGAPVGRVDLIIVAAVFAPTVVALVILRSRPTNRIGWIMALGPLPIAVLSFCEGYSRSGATEGHPLPGHVWFGVVSVSLWPAFYVWPLAIALLFPDGHLPSPRWRPAAIATLTAPVLVVLGVFFGQERLEPSQGSAENPVYIGESPVLTTVFWLVWLVMFAGLFVGAAAVVVRFRRVGWRRAAAAEMARLVGGADPARAGVLRALVPDRRRGGGHRPDHSPGGGDRDQRVGGDRHHAPRALRDRPGRQPHPRLRGAHGASRGRLRRDRSRSRHLRRRAARRSPPRSRPSSWRWPSAPCARASRTGWTGASPARATRGCGACASSRTRCGAARRPPRAWGRPSRAALGDPGAVLWLRLPQSEVYAGVNGRVIGVDAPPADRAMTRVTQRGEELGIVLHDPGAARAPGPAAQRAGRRGPPGRAGPPARGAAHAAGRGGGVARAPGACRRRGAAAPRARPARRRPAAPGGPRRGAAPRAALAAAGGARARPGPRPGRAGGGQRDHRPAHDRRGPAPAAPRRRPRRRARRPRPQLSPAGHRAGGGRGPAAAARGGRLLHGVRGGHERRQARGRDADRCRGDPASGPPGGARRGRRRGRRGGAHGQRPHRHRRPGGGARAA